MTGPTQSPTSDTAPDPTEIDLEEVKVHLEVRSPLMSDSVALIAAVEALRMQVAEAEGIAATTQRFRMEDANEAMELLRSENTRAESAEAHAVELAGALGPWLLAAEKDYGSFNYYTGCVSWNEDEGEKEESATTFEMLKNADTALKATPPDALERSRARGWQPFETAPENGKPVCVYREDAGVFTAIYVSPAEATFGNYSNDYEPLWFTTGGEDLTGDLPSLWMPEPTP